MTCGRARQADGRNRWMGMTNGSPRSSSVTDRRTGATVALHKSMFRPSVGRDRQSMLR